MFLWIFESLSALYCPIGYWGYWVPYYLKWVHSLHFAFNLSLLMLNKHFSRKNRRERIYLNINIKFSRILGWSSNVDSHLKHWYQTGLWRREARRRRRGGEAAFFGEAEGRRGGEKITGKRRRRGEEANDFRRRRRKVCGRRRKFFEFFPLLTILYGLIYPDTQDNWFL